MRVSRSFLNEYVDLSGIETLEIADKMVFAGNEYDSIEKLSEATNLVVGEVVSCVPHKESTKLSICMVNLGTEEVQILCGAPNVATGQKVIVAKVGAKLPGGITIGKAKLAGMESNGMICSLAELGIESKYLSEEDKHGIYVLDENAVVGEDAIAYLGYDDEVIDFDLTANRADLLSYLGMAYEVGAIYGKKVKLPETQCSCLEENIKEQFTLEVETERCPIYLGKIVRNIVIKESPLFIKNRLMASGIRPINNVVDISNYVMLEYGQPLHFFDLDQLGHKIVVRTAKEGEEITTLDGQKRNLKCFDLVITDGSKPVALAGVMGGLDTEVTQNTKNLFLESAIFDTISIRKTAKDILRSEASNRYEKGVDPNRTKEALLRACYLLSVYAGGEVVDGLVEHDVADKKEKEIDINLDKINSVLGFSLKVEEVEDVFDRLGFVYKREETNFHVIVPTRRGDITIAEDLLEEIGRIYGYQHLKGSLPIVSVKRGSRSHKQDVIRYVKKVLTGAGLNEVITYSLISEAESKLFLDHESETILLLDPLNEERKYMRKSLIPSLVQVYETNASRNQKDVFIFEVGSCYEPELEEVKVSGLLSGMYLENIWQGKKIKTDFYVLKGVVEQLLIQLGFSNRYQFMVEDVLSDLHPGRSCRILVDQETIGYMGQIHPGVNKKELYVFELSLEKLLQKQVRLMKQKDISKYPTVLKDMAFLVPKDMKSSCISEVIQKVAGRLLVDLTVFDVFEMEDQKSIAFSLTFQDMNKTLEEQEINDLFYRIIDQVTTTLHITLRDH